MRKYRPLNLIAAALVLIMAGFFYCTEYAPNRKGTTEVVACILVFSAALITGSFFITALLCHNWIKYKKRLSNVMVFPAAYISFLLTTVCGSLAIGATPAFIIPRLSTLGWPAILELLALCQLGTLVSAFASWGVVAYYKKGLAGRFDIGETVISQKNFE
jgi:hypothetical protein